MSPWSPKKGRKMPEKIYHVPALISHDAFELNHDVNDIKDFVIKLPKNLQVALFRSSESMYARRGILSPL